MINEPGFRENLWRRFEGAVDAFHDTDREVLPATAWQFILYFARQAKGPFALLLVMGGLVGAVDAALYWSIGWLIDLLDSATPQTLFAEHWHELAGLLALLLVIRTAVLIGSALVEQQVIVPGFYSMVRWQSFRRVIEQPYDFYQNDFAGRIATKIMQGGEAVGDFIVNVLQTMWAFVTFVVLAITILSSVDPWMGLVVALWVASYAGIVWYLLPEMRRAGRATADERSVFNGRLVDAFTNIMSVKLFDSGRREHAYVRDGLQSYFLAVVRLTRAVTTVRSAIAIINGIMMSTIAAICIVKWTGGGISTGAIAAALGLVFRLNQMSGWMMFNINGLVRNYATVQDATRTISVRPALRDAPDAEVLPPARGDIRFENVSFHYGKTDGIIDNFNLHIRPGERVALIGPSGAGKTTVVNLLLRLFDIEGGRILVDGHDIRSVTQASLRAAVRRRQPGRDADAPLDRRQYRLRQGRGLAGGDRRRGQAGVGRRIHRRRRRSARPQGLRGACRRARRQAVGRPAPAHRDRPHDAQGCADPDPRRGDLGARFGGRGGDPGQSLPADGGQDRDRHRPPAVDDRRARPADRARRGQDRRAGHA